MYDLPFARFGLHRKVLAALVLEDIETPTPVQSAVLPDALSGRDVLARARTGSGKTLAFGIPAVARLAGRTSEPNRPRALVIVPTRELAGQVERSMQLIARALRLRLMTVYGGTRYDVQVRGLRDGADIVVGTPGRLLDLIERGVLRTDAIEVTVLDEADHLCDLGFYPDVDKLLSLTPADGQRLLLSATLDGDVDRLVADHLREPRRHEIDPGSSAVTTMAHHVLTAGGFRAKIDAVVSLVRANPRTIVFTRTREGATELRDALAEQGLTAVDLHGNLTQRVRERNLERFSSGRAQAVVATDVAARGIHVDGISMVVHFDPPSDPKAYLHRSGRTARAGESGAVVTLVTPKQTGTVLSMQREAGVTARFHDVRTAPEPMTAEALAESGEEKAPREAGRGGHRPSGRGGYQGAKGRKPYRSSAGDRPHRGGDKPFRAKPRGETARGFGKPGAGAPATSKPAGKRTGAKQRWTKDDPRRSSF